MRKKIGIPRALLYYKYYPFWKTFLEKLGCEVVTSGQTNQKILQKGIKHTIDESCLPVKVFCGHILDLIEKGVDYLFIPRIESVEKRHFVCTKFLGLPDIVRNCIPLTSKMSKAILSPNIDFNRRFLYQSMFSVGCRLTKNPIKIHTAYWQARKKQQNFEGTLRLTRTPQEVIELTETGSLGTDVDSDLKQVAAPLLQHRHRNDPARAGATSAEERLNPVRNKLPRVTADAQTHRISNGVNIALIGHPYNVYDNFINLGIIKKLQHLGVNVFTPEMVPQKASRRVASEVSEDIYWTYGKEILGASLYFVEKGIDGIIFIISFPCGPDSLTIEYAIREIKDRVPVISLVLDEHQAEPGTVTRLESFIDLVRIRRGR